MVLQASMLLVYNSDAMDVILDDIHRALLNVIVQSLSEKLICYPTISMQTQVLLQFSHTVTLIDALNATIIVRVRAKV